MLLLFAGVFAGIVSAQEPQQTFRVPLHSVNNVFFWLLLGLAIAGTVWFLAGIVRVFLSKEFRRDVDRLRKLRNERRSKRGKHLLLLALLTVLTVTLLLFSGLVSAQEPQRTFRIPFRTVNNLILLDATVNGKAAVLLLDTGANRTALSPSAAGLNISEQARATQANREGNYVVRGVDLKLEQCRWANQLVIVADLSQRTHMHIDGLLGQDILREFSSVRIDFKNQVLELESAQ